MSQHRDAAQIAHVAFTGIIMLARALSHLVHMIHVWKREQERLRHRKAEKKGGNPWA